VDDLGAALAVHESYDTHRLESLTVTYLS
jgi:hypothetical protein